MVGINTRGTGTKRWAHEEPAEHGRAIARSDRPNSRQRPRPRSGHGVGAVRRDRFALVGRGPAGIIAAYAALFAPGTVIELVIADPPLSHRDGPHFLNVLRVLDIPEALGLLAPEVKLTLIGKNAKDKAFDKTAAIYEAGRGEGQIQVPAERI